MRLNTIAERVEWKPGEVSVHVRAAEGGAKATLQARCAIVTVSLGVLQAGAIEFDPEPVHALEAARTLAFGQAMRVTLRFERAYQVAKHSGTWTAVREGHVPKEIRAEPK